MNDRKFVKFKYLFYGQAIQVESAILFLILKRTPERLQPGPVSNPFVVQTKLGVNISTTKRTRKFNMYSVGVYISLFHMLHVSQCLQRPHRLTRPVLQNRALHRHTNSSMAWQALACRITEN